MLGSSSNGADRHDALTAAARVLARGGIVVYPTETLYALGADAGTAVGLQRLVDLKVRRPGKPIAVLIGDLDMLTDIVVEIPAPARLLMRHFWPGPLTLVFRARPHVSPLLTGGDTGIGVRLSSDPLATALVRALGRPVTAPSANPAGLAPPASLEQARTYFGSQVDSYLDGGTLPGEPASTVVDVRDGFALIREGAVPANALWPALSHRLPNPDSSPGNDARTAPANGAR
ncbi:MAG: L-threonylcarbamoyladenylate synthase [Candidatus Binatia bacterium]